MGFQAIAAGTDGSELDLGFTPLIPSGLEYINHFGGNAFVGRNLFGNTATVIGTPTVGSMSEGVTFKALSNYLDTKVAHKPAMTFLAIVKTGVNALLLSNYQGAVSGNVSLSVDVDANGTFVKAFYGTVITGSGETKTYSIPLSARHSANEWMTVAMRFNPNVAIGQRFLTVHDLTRSSTASLTSNASQTPTIGPTILVGSSFVAWGDGTPTMLFAGIWSRELTNDELLRQYARLKAFYANTKGVLV